MSGALGVADAALAIASCALPSRLTLALPPGTVACVQPGQRVRRGERIAQALDDRAVPLHAPAGGVVVASLHAAGGVAAASLHAAGGVAVAFLHAPGGVAVASLHAAGGMAVASVRAAVGVGVPAVDDEFIAIDVDPNDQDSVRLPPLDWQHASPDELIARLHEAGVVGLGGAAFPTARKLAHPRRLLILDAAECEPWIGCDDALLRERAAQVLDGGRVLARACGATRTQLAIAQSMPAALAAARAALGAADDIEIVTVPAIYPQGGERQLIETLTGEQVPHGGLPRDLGIVVHNVGTAAAAWRAVAQGEPLTSRIVSVGGRGVARAGHYEVAFGTPIARLIAQAGGYTDEAARLLLGGPMMGTALADDERGIDARCNGVLVLGDSEVRRVVPQVGAGCNATLDDDDVRNAVPALPCIRCGACADACPARLLPQQLHALLNAGEDVLAIEHGLSACIECGCCDVVCPSGLPLVEQFRVAKREIAQRTDSKAMANASRTRFLARNARLAREAQERVLRDAQRRTGASSAVQAALERAKARKRADE